MAIALRKTGISVIGDAPWGTHFCHFYETAQDLLDTLAPYFKAGLENNEFCLWVVSNSELITVKNAKEALAQVVPDLDRFLSNGNIEILDGFDWYLEKNKFNLERVMSALDQKLQRALALGYEGMRVSGDTLWLRETDWRDFCTYEKQLNDSITDRPVNLMCTYSLAKSGAAEVLDVVQVHHFATARRQGEWNVIETPELIQARNEIKRLNYHLQRVKKRTPKPALILKYGLAVLSVTAALIITLWMRMQLGQASTPIVALFLCSVMLSAWFGGIRPGLLAIALSLLAFNYYFVPPFYSLAVEIKEIPRVLVFGLSALLLGLLSAAQRNATNSLIRARDVLDGIVEELKQTNVVLRAEISERKRAEEQLKQSEGQLAEAQRLAHVGSWNWELPSNTITWSDELYRLFGVDQQTFNPAYEEFVTDFIHPQDRALVRDITERALKSREPYSFHNRIIRPDGEERVVHVRGAVVSDEHGSPIRVFGTAQDVTERKRAEEVLKESQRRLEEAQRIAHVGHWERDLRTGVITWSDEIYRILGHSPRGHDSPLTEWQHLIHPEDRERVALVIEEAQRGIRRYDVEYRIVRPDGDVRFIHSQGDVIRDEHGELLRAFGIAQDITERKLAEEALDERLRFETLLTELSAAFANLSPNEVDREIDKWLQTLVESLGVDRASFFQFGEDWTTLYRSHSYSVPGIEPLPPLPIGMKEQFPWITDQLRQGVTVKWSRIPDDMPKDAEKEKEYAARLGVKSTLNIPVRMGGSVICAITFTSIVTCRDWSDAMIARLRLVGEIFAAALERKRAEGALRAAEQKYRAIFENAGEGIFQSTPEGRYLEANPALAEMYGFGSPEELIHCWQDISRQVYVDSTRREEFKRQLDDQGAVRGFELEVFRKDGTTLWISVNARAVEAENGAIQYYEGTARDITERKAAEEQLKATSEQLRALSARLQSAREEEGTRIAREIHDELGSALTSLKWDLEELDKILSTSSGQSELTTLRAKLHEPMKLADMAISATRRIASELRPSILDDLGLIAAIEWQAEQFQARTGILCVYECGLENLELSEAQSTAVFRILQETLTNVIRHAQATRVDIKINQTNGDFVLAISDNGKGITEREKSDPQSLGILGMRERAHLISAQIEILGVEGHGTMVTVRVPILDEKGASPISHQ